MCDGFEVLCIFEELQVQCCFDVIDGIVDQVDNDINDYVELGSVSVKVLIVMKEVEFGFVVGFFFGGVKFVYEMILMVFEWGDLFEVCGFLVLFVVEVFESVIVDCKFCGFVIEVQFFGICEIVLVVVEFNFMIRLVEFLVCFVGEMIVVICDVDGNVVDGDLKLVCKQCDIWIFVCQMGLDDLNW